MTFFKEGMATLGEALYKARLRETAQGGPSTAAGQRGFEDSLRRAFASDYDSTGDFWTQAPSDPTAANLFSSSATYNRPAAAYIALREIVGHTRFVQVLRRVQHDFGGRSITEPQWESAWRAALPTQSAACERRLTDFFHQWFDTAYPAGGAPHRPVITGPNLEGENFYGHGGCAAPA
jgi:hypothetical protein